MAKKKNNDDLIDSLFQGFNINGKSWTKGDFKKIFSQKDPEKLTQKERMIIIASAICVQNNITPTTYAELYDIASKEPIVNMMPLDILFESAANKNDDIGTGDFDDYSDDKYYGDTRQRLMSFPLPGAANKTLVLRIQLRDIKKPPLWREVRIPADYNFEQLHEMIQILFDWDNAHLWQFEDKPYSHGYIIGPEMEDTGFGEGPTDIASLTPVTKVLKQKNDKMVYVYDFGDDWVHDITVKDILEEKSERAECLKWKGDNPIEDVGGIWGLETYRHMYDPATKPTKKEIKEFLENSWFDNMKDFKEFMASHEFNLEEVNERLKGV